jgi:TRAP-type C4-dicarboxylate transport system permease small subunit
MLFFMRCVNWATAIFRWGAVATVAAMALLIVYAVLMRAVATPVAGEHELIQLMMVAMVMLGLAYTQQQQSHITIGLLVDRFSPRWQAAVDLLGALLVLTSCGVIGWANLLVAVDYATEMPMSTDFLSIPLYPFQFAVGLGFWLWGLQAVARVPDAFRGARGDPASASQRGHA